MPPSSCEPCDCPGNFWGHVDSYRQAILKIGCSIYQTLTGTGGGVEFQFGDSPSVDAFARLRVSHPATLFDSKQIYDNSPLFWDDQEVSGGGTTSVHSADAARTRLAVAATTAGRRIRQTFMRFNYQPGKSQLSLLTFVQSALSSAGTTVSLGYYDDDNGVFFRDNGGTLQIVRRSSASGSPVDVAVDQTDWNIDPLDGTGASGLTIDVTKTNILAMDFEWLGVGRVRCAFVIDGQIVPFHAFNNANNLDVVYMSTPNLPLRYEIENDGAGPALSLDHICSTVISEGGSEALGSLHHLSTGDTQLDANASGALYAMLGLRLRSSHLSLTALIENISVLASTNDNFEYLLLFNPTVNGTFTYSDYDDSGMQAAIGATANTIDPGNEGVVVEGRWVSSNSAESTAVPNARRLGAAIDGTPDELVVAVRPLSVNLDVYGSITWRELL